MPFYHRIYCPGQLQFITSSTYRRTPLFLSDRFRRGFVQRLEEMRQELHFLLVGWVLMLDYTHNNPVTRGLVSSPGDWP